MSTINREVYNISIVKDAIAVFIGESNPTQRFTVVAPLYFFSSRCRSVAGIMLNHGILLDVAETIGETIKWFAVNPNQKYRRGDN